MKKELFVKSINAIETQLNLDIEFSKNIGKAFTSAFEANLLPNNNVLVDALVEVLEIMMNDIKSDDNSTWIQYYLWELDFGRENYRLKAYDENKKEIDLGDAGKLWEFLNENKKLVMSDVSGNVFDDKIDEWHNSDTPLSLYEYLGLTEEQFKIWLKNPEQIEKHYR